MRYFIDTEFIEHKQSIELISIGVVAENGREFYAVNEDFNAKRANQWVRDNVLPLLPERRPLSVWQGGSPRIAIEAEAWMPAYRIRSRLMEFVGHDTPELWGYYCAYDYVILSQLMGGMEDWPPTWPYLMYDFRQWLDERDLQEIRQTDDAPHDALEDARWIRGTYLELAHGWAES